MRRSSRRLPCLPRLQSVRPSPPSLLRPFQPSRSSARPKYGAEQHLRARVTDGGAAEGARRAHLTPAAERPPLASPLSLSENPSLGGKLQLEILAQIEPPDVGVR